MWAGQLACEGFNWAVKHAIKEDRPVGMSSSMCAGVVNFMAAQRVSGMAMAFLRHTANIWDTLRPSSSATSTLDKHLRPPGSFSSTMHLEVWYT